MNALNTHTHTHTNTHARTHTHRHKLKHTHSNMQTHLLMHVQRDTIALHALLQAKDPDVPPVGEIARMRRLFLSATNTVPLASTATPVGWSKDACVPIPFAYPRVSPPASDVTTAIKTISTQTTTM